MVMKLDEGITFTPCPKIFVIYKMLTRDLFAVANLVNEAIMPVGYVG